MAFSLLVIFNDLRALSSALCCAVISLLLRRLFGLLTTGLLPLLESVPGWFEATGCRL